MAYTSEQVAAMLKRKSITQQEAAFLMGNPGYSGSLAAMRDRRSAGQDAVLEAELSRTNVDHPFMFIFARLENYDDPVDFGGWDDRTVLPVAPPSFDYSIKNNAQTFTSMSGKTFSHAGAEDLLRISFETFLPAGLTSGSVEVPSYVYQSVEHGFFEPPEFVDKIQAAQAANQPFLFSILQSQSTADGVKIIYPTPMTVQDFSPSYSAGQGHDIAFSISLQAWNPQAQAMTTGNRLYVTKPGDKYSCGNIAQKQLKNVKRYVEIKAINKAILDADHAKRLKLNKTNKSVRIDLITPGTRLMIPGA